MSEKGNTKGGKTNAAEAPKKPVVAAKPSREAADGPSKCKSEECKKKPEKFGFCMEHYEFYMAGILRGDGKKPVDYEEKLSKWQEKSKKVA